MCFFSLKVKYLWQFPVRLILSFGKESCYRNVEFCYHEIKSSYAAYSNCAGLLDCLLSFSVKVRCFPAYVLPMIEPWVCNHSNEVYYKQCGFFFSVFNSTRHSWNLLGSISVIALRMRLIFQQ